MEPSRLIWIVVVPAVIALTSLAAAWRPWSTNRPADASCRWGAAIGFTAALLFGVVYVMGRWPALQATREGDWLPLRPRLGEDWIPYLAIGAGLFALARSHARWRAWMDLVARIVLSAAVVVLVLQNIIRSEWSQTQVAYVVLGAFTVVLAAWWWSIDALADFNKGFAYPFALWIVCSAATVSLALSSTAKLGEFCAPLAACMGSAWLLSLWRRDLTLARSGTPVLAVGLSASMLGAYYFTGTVHWVVVVLLSLAPVAAWIVRLGRVRRMHPWKQSCVQIAAVALPAIAAVIVAAVLRQSRGEEAYPY